MSIAYYESLKSALSGLTRSLNSLLDVNILYGSETPTVIRSSINTPIKDSFLFSPNSDKFNAFLPALIPAIIPYDAASS